LAELPDLDPLVPSPKVPFDIWEEAIKDISKKVGEYIDMRKIYKIIY